MATFIGREKESALLREYMASNHAEFIGIYGRRRVGKTFLVNQVLKDQLAFSVSGLLYGKKSEQVSAFQIALREYGYEKPLSSNWLELFYALQELMTQKIKNGQPCIIFIDELPCFDRKGGAFVRALGQFWNTWAADRLPEWSSLYPPHHRSCWLRHAVPVCNMLMWMTMP